MAQQWLFERILNTFKSITPEKFQVFCSSESTLSVVNTFIFSESTSIFIYEIRGSLTINSIPPAQEKNLYVYYVLKLAPLPLSEAGFVNEVIFGDFIGSPLNHLNNTACNVYLPLLSNPSNREVWSDMVAKELMENFNHFLSDVQITEGYVKGVTILPLPPQHEIEEDQLATMTTDTTITDNLLFAHQERVHVLESAIIVWTKQIRLVLKNDPEDLLKKQGHPGPLEELEFWDNQSYDLNGIFRQLQGEKVRRVLRYLDQSQSTYNVPFAKLCKEVFQARIEANSNRRFLRPLRPWLEQLENSEDFENLTNLFAPIIHTLLLIWKASPYYNTPARLVIIVREICNSLIRKAYAYINGRKVFELIDAEEIRKAIDMLKTTLVVFGQFKTVYFDYKVGNCTYLPSTIFIFVTSSHQMSNTRIFIGKGQC